LDASIPATLLDLLRGRAWEFGDACAFRFLRDDGTQTDISFSDLDRGARAVAQRLRARIEPGQRAVLMFPPGLEFIQAFFGCVYAGVLAVPMSFPRRRDLSSRISAIVEDCRATVGLTASTGTDVLKGIGENGHHEQLHWIAVDAIEPQEADDWEPPDVEADDLAFLQYTSGSTDRPRGVMVSHGNLLHNLEMIRQGFGVPYGSPDDPSGVGVSWLPMYHDMGLIGGVLASLWVGGMTALMAPTSFPRRPERWLQAISDYGARVSGAPNFAYDLCVRKIDDACLESLDLSQWRVAFCGAEPIRPETLDRFAERFGPCGFRPDAFYPCYGLAEATLLVTGNHGPRVPIIRRFRRSRLQLDGVAEPSGDQTGNHQPGNHQPGDTSTGDTSTGDDADGDTRRLVGCGTTLLDQSLAIVDPATRVRCAEGVVGEIWVRGASVSSGYWGSNGRCGEFDARLSDTAEGPFLRTGDLGFVLDGELFVTGRLKELLIIRGRNLDPADIEHTAQSAHPALAPDSGAAFSHEIDGEERLVLVNERDRAHRKTSFDEVFRSVRRRITEQHGVFPHAVVLIRPTTLPRTTSGKIQRTLTSELYANRELKVVARWSIQDKPRRPADPPLRANGAAAGSRRADRLARQIERRILDWLQDRVGVADEELDRDRPFAEHGVDSMAALELSCELENWLQVELSPHAAWQYPTPAAIARYLAVESLSSGGNGRPGSDAIAPEEPTTPAEDAGLAELLDGLENISESDAAELLDLGESSDG